MTTEEIILMKELIKEAVGSIIKESIKEAMETSMKKDLKEVKLLLAKVIKEGYSQPKQMTESVDTAGREARKQAMREAIGEDFRTMIHATTDRVNVPIPRMSEEQAMNASINGTLPDFDAPIPFINKNSVIYKDMKERVNG